MFSLADSVAAAQERTGVPGVAAALHLDGTTSFAGSAETPFRIASITKSFTSTLVSELGRLDDRTRALLSHTAGYRPESREPLPPECAGLWSYSNAGYREAAPDDFADCCSPKISCSRLPAALSAWSSPTPDSVCSSRSRSS